MRHTFFALFNDPEKAAAALRDVAALGIPEDQYSLVVHRGRLKDSELEGFETEQRSGPLVGLLAGAGLGALTGGVLAGPLGLIGVGWLMSSATCAAAGSAYGVVFGALVGSSLPDHTLAQMSRALEEGQVLVAVNVDGGMNEEVIERLFMHHDAITQHKSLWRHAEA